MAAIHYRPPMCSERETGKDEDCTWCAGVMLQNAAQGRTLARSTREEYEGLRVDGTGGPARVDEVGSDLTDLKKGITKRYGWTPRLTSDDGVFHPPWATILRSLGEVGDAAVLQGSMGVFQPKTHHFRRHGREFDGPHAVYVQRVDLEPRLWWMDPQAPNSYDGEFISLKLAKTYYEGLIGAAAFVRVGAKNKGSAVPGLATTPAEDLIMGVVRIQGGAEVINVETRKRVKISATGATRQAVGPFTRDFGNVKGFFIRHQDPDTPDLDFATYWVPATSCTFTPN